VSVYGDFLLSVDTALRKAAPQRYVRGRRLDMFGERAMTRHAFVGLFALLAATACGSVNNAGGPSDPGHKDSGSATVSGQVYWPSGPTSGPQGRTLKGIPIHFSWVPDRVHVMTTSNALGEYSIRLHPGTYVVIAGHADHSVYEQQLSVQAGEAVTLDIPVSPATGA
jgi:hypothetical protein